MTTPSSTLVLLSELGSLKHNTKVRFVGCIIDYDTSTATLTLTASYPQQSQPRPAPTTQKPTNPPAATTTDAPPAPPKPGHIHQQAIPPTRPAPQARTTTTIAQVNARLVLPPVTDRKLFEVGTWVSVVGYVTAPPSSEWEGMERKEGIAHVQALLLMDARSRDPRQFLQGVGMRVGEGSRGSGWRDGDGDGDADADGANGYGDGDDKGSRLGRYEKAVLARRRAGEALRESAGI